MHAHRHAYTRTVTLVCYATAAYCNSLDLRTTCKKGAGSFWMPGPMPSYKVGLDASRGLRSRCARFWHEGGGQCNSASESTANQGIRQAVGYKGALILKPPLEASWCQAFEDS